MTPRRTAREIEIVAAGAGPPRPAAAAPASEALAMLARRGVHPTAARPDVPFPLDLEPDRAARLAASLDHYAFRLFLRGAIERRRGFAPAEATRYLSPAQARAHAEALVTLGLARRLGRGRYALRYPARSFGGTLEWYVARELERRFGCDVASSLKLRIRGVGGDLDVVAAAEGKLVCLELKSSPPSQLKPGEIRAFLLRVRALRPDLALFVIDTSLRLSDRVLPLFAGVLGVRVGTLRRVERELWAVTPHLYLVNAGPDLLANVGRALAHGLHALAPAPP